jgi:WD40 repeat protein
VCWNQDAERILGGYYDGTVKVWDVKSGTTILEIKTELRDMWAAIYSPDATMIATGGHSEDSEKEFIKIWNANTGKLVTNLKGDTSERVYCLAWTSGGTLISGLNDCSIRTWNTTTWEQIAVWTGHTSTSLDIAISPNGRIFASASSDNTAQLWNLENGQPIGSPMQHADIVNCLSFSTDGNLLATGCSDHNAYTWDISVIVEDASSELPSVC